MSHNASPKKRGPGRPRTILTLTRDRYRAAKKDFKVIGKATVVAKKHNVRYSDLSARLKADGIELKRGRPRKVQEIPA